MLQCSFNMWCAHVDVPLLEVSALPIGMTAYNSSTRVVLESKDLY
jgi:hypothetical protein